MKTLLKKEKRRAGIARRGLKICCPSPGQLLAGIENRISNAKSHSLSRPEGFLLHKNIFHLGNQLRFIAANSGAQTHSKRMKTLLSAYERVIYHRQGYGCR